MEEAKQGEVQSIKLSGSPGEPDWERVARLLLTARKIDENEEKELAGTGKISYPSISA